VLGKPGGEQNISPFYSSHRNVGLNAGGISRRRIHREPKSAASALPFRRKRRRCSQSSSFTTIVSRGQSGVRQGRERSSLGLLHLRGRLFSFPKRGSDISCRHSWQDCVICPTLQAELQIRLDVPQIPNQRKVAPG
jgi:hypothetical protein